MNKKLLTTAAIAAILGLVGTDYAADANRRKNTAGKADTDKDGKVSQAEFIASVKDRMDESKAKTAFGKRDKNGDGFLDAEELKAAGGKKGEGEKGGEKKRKKDQ